MHLARTRQSIGSPLLIGHLLVLMVLGAAGAGGQGRAGEAESELRISKDSSGLALEGYDPVAYFEQGVAVEGSAEIEWTWQSALWRFSSERHRELFQSDPERYAPQYGGYCAWAASRSKIAPGSAQHWMIVEGRLFLNFNARIHKKWSRRASDLIEEADRRWPELVNDSSPAP